MTMGSLFLGLVFLCFLFLGDSHPIFFDDEPAPICGHDLEKAVREIDLSEGASELMNLAQSSVDEYKAPTRVIGSQGHDETLQYITLSLKKLLEYYDFYTQKFTAKYSKVFNYDLSINGCPMESALPFKYTPSIEATGKLKLAENEGCEIEDYPEDLEGYAALISRGGCSFAQKSKVAKTAGASLAIIYNTEDGPLKGTLHDPQFETCDLAASIGISKDDADKLFSLMESGTPHFEAYIDACVKEVPTTNIIAETKAGDHDNVVMLGAHSDSVSAGPGINDNGSGSITLLLLAKYLTKFKINNAVRLAWWSAEEEGLLGSNYYTDNLTEEENKKIRLFLDYDMLASPNYAFEVYDSDDATNPEGSSKIRDLFTSWYEKNGYSYKLIPFDGRSDYVGFIKNSIPAGGIATGAERKKTEEEQEIFGGTAGEPYDSCYHQLCDDLDNLNYEAWVVNTRLIAYSLGTYADSLDDFPERDITAISSTDSNPTFKYLGDRLLY